MNISAMLDNPKMLMPDFVKKIDKAKQLNKTVSTFSMTGLSDFTVALFTRDP
jgi:hypothetical protein